MPQLRHLAIAARDPKRLADFYRQVFDLKTVREDEKGVFLSDGVFCLGLLATPEGRSLGLRSDGFAVEDLKEVRGRLEKNGAKTPDPAESAIMSYAEFQAADPDGNLVVLSEKGFGVSAEKTPVPIRHIALYTPDPRRVADFYGRVFSMKEVAKTDRSSIFVSDGYFNLALLYQRSDERLGFNHFGFHVKSIEEIQRKAEKGGVTRGARRPDRIPYAEYRLHDPEGNGIDISEKGWEV